MLASSWHIVVSFTIFISWAKRICRVVKRAAVVKTVNRLRPGIASSWKLHHDNAPCNITTRLDVPSSSAAQTWFHLTFSPHLKGAIDCVQATVTMTLGSFPENDPQTAFHNWRAYYTRCVEHKVM